MLLAHQSITCVFSPQSPLLHRCASKPRERALHAVHAATGHIATVERSPLYVHWHDPLFEASPTAPRSLAACHLSRVAATIGRHCGMAHPRQDKQCLDKATPPNTSPFEADHCAHPLRAAPPLAPTMVLAPCRSPRPPPPDRGCVCSLRASRQ
jgi:hypothetical protein